MKWSLFGIMLVVNSLALTEPRVTMTVESDWMFILQNPPGAEATEFPDSSWDEIDLPHTWNAFDGQDGGNNYYRGVGWYRKHFSIDDAFRTKQLFLRFDAAAITAVVYFNGILIGSHKGAFSAFCFDITPVVKFDSPNVIAVQVSNTADSTVAPLRGDFTIFGGLYRGVQLLALEDLSISPLDFASSGVYVKQSEVSLESADLEITTVLRNASSIPKTASIRSTIFDEWGDPVASVESERSLAPGLQEGEIQKTSIRNPRLWNGRIDPYLYRVVVEVHEGKVLKDRIVQSFGVRYFTVDAERGFFLNGAPYRLIGVNRHQDRQDKGWAIGRKEHEEDYRLIEEMGCSAVRLAHYQQAREFYDLCDRGGMIVVAEVALVDFVHPDEAFENNIRMQLTELIKQNFNHPSIFFWSLFNELIPDSDRDLYGNLVIKLNTLAHALDPTRLTTMASRSMYDGNEFINTVTDAIGYNVYKGWYEEMPEDFAAYADTLHARFPGHKISITEYGAGAGTTQHEVPPRKPTTTARWHPEEWQAVYHEEHWKAIETRPFLWGTFVWNMFDFASDSRLEGERPGRNDKGLVTYDRQTKKDAFYWYKVHWNPAPMVHITSRRFTPRPGGPTEVKVYSNCDSVALFLNGLRVGTRFGEARIFSWDVVHLVNGTNRIEALGKKDGKTYRDFCVWEAE